MGSRQSNAEAERKAKTKKNLPLKNVSASEVPGQSYIRADGTIIPPAPLPESVLRPGGMEPHTFGQLQALTDKYSGLGYLKICPSDTPGSVFIYYKYNQGQWRNHYVVVLGPLEQWQYLIQLLFDKTTEVTMGLRRPQYDSYPGQQ